MRLKTPTVRKALGLTGLLITLAFVSPGARAQDFQIRTRVDLVVVPVAVKGSGDRLITGLTKEDFIVLEDGRRQTITNFTIDPVPLSAAILVDTGLSSGSLSKVQESFTALAEAFSDFDEVAVYRFDNDVSRILDFSNDRLVVETAMKTLKDIKPSNPPTASGGPFSTPGPVINGVPVAPSAQVGARIPPKNFKVLHDAIFAAASDLVKRETSRRRMVLVISDGGTAGSDHSFDETVGRLLDTGIQVYAIGMDTSFFTRRFSVLDSYAKTTGGDAFFLNSLNALEAAYGKAAEQARNQYILAYVSNNRVAGKEPVFREIDVKLARADLEILHRKGYYQHP